jgi:hypothetical protein
VEGRERLPWKERNPPVIVEKHAVIIAIRGFLAAVEVRESLETKQSTREGKCSTDEQGVVMLFRRHGLPESLPRKAPWKEPWMVFVVVPKSMSRTAPCHQRLVAWGCPSIPLPPLLPPLERDEAGNIEAVVRVDLAVSREVDITKDEKLLLRQYRLRREHPRVLRIRNTPRVPVRLP